MIKMCGERRKKRRRFARARFRMALLSPVRRVSALVIRQRFDTLHPSGDVGKALRKREEA